MNVKRRSRNAQTPSYPQKVDEWREAIGKALGLTPEEAKSQFRKDTFPFDDLTVWIHQKFGSDKGYSPDFVPALIRNCKGLIAWVYDDGSEPYWPGPDETSVERV